MEQSTIKFTSFPRTNPPPPFVSDLVNVFRQHEAKISTTVLKKGLDSDGVLAELRADLVHLGFDVESGKRMADKIDRPVFFGENGEPTLRYQIDAFHSDWECGLEVEAGRAFMGNAFYRDLIQACVMVQVNNFVVAVPNSYKYLSKGKPMVSQDYNHAISLAETLYGHSRMRLPYNLTILGY